MVKCHIGYTWQKDELISLHGIIEFSNVAIYWREEEQTASNYTNSSTKDTKSNNFESSWPRKK